MNNKDILDIIYMAGIVEAHSEKFPVPSHAQALAKRIIEICRREKNFTWQPIETAPRDRLILLGLFPHRGFLEMPRKVGGWWDDKWNIFGGSWTPTHWTELPEPIKDKDNQ